jgi:membrane protease YdiL (CAAX protease family)
MQRTVGLRFVRRQVETAFRTRPRDSGTPVLWTYTCLMLLAANSRVIKRQPSLAGGIPGVLFGLTVSVTSLLYSSWIARSSWDELGLAPLRRVPASVGFGLFMVSFVTAGAVLTARGLRAIGIPVEAPEPPGDLPAISRAAVLRRAVLYVPLDTALPEELLFRSVLLSELGVRFRGRLVPVLLSSAAFVIWHGALGWSEVPDHDPRKLIQKYGFYALGSLVFSVPRLLTGHVAGSIAAHWFTDALLLFAGHPSGRWLRTLAFPE